MHLTVEQNELFGITNYNTSNCVPIIVICPLCSHTLRLCRNYKLGHGRPVLQVHLVCEETEWFREGCSLKRGLVAKNQLKAETIIVCSNDW